jgi:phenylalanyl-tRNA synthetase alpha chain
MQSIEDVRKNLLEGVAVSLTPRDILRSPDIKALYSQLPSLAPEKRSEFGKAVNDLKVEVEAAIEAREAELDSAEVVPLDVTAPWDVNTTGVGLLPTEQGTWHPLTKELDVVVDIFTRMGFEAIESRQIDDDFHMFGSLNFPENHPARDGYDTFRTEEEFISPAHTSTMQNRILKDGKAKLEAGGQIAAISYGRVFRNEDVDATHEHTFYQVEGVFVSEKATLGDMLGVLRSFFE